MTDIDMSWWPWKVEKVEKPKMAKSNADLANALDESAEWLLTDGRQVSEIVAAELTDAANRLRAMGEPVAWRVKGERYMYSDEGVVNRIKADNPGIVIIPLYALEPKE